MVLWTLVEANEMPYTPARAGPDIKIGSSYTSKSKNAPLLLLIMFFYANDDDGGGDNDEQVNIFSIFKDGRRKSHMPHLKKKKKEIQCVRGASIPGWGVHSCGVSANCRGDDYLLLGGRVT